MRFILFLIYFSLLQLNGQESCFPIEELIGKSIPKDTKNPYLLRNEVYTAFLKMKKKALHDNISIVIVSGYRSFYRQQQIWNNKYIKYTKQGLSDSLAIEKIINYSTIPGTSRHHWGTDIDIIQKIKTPPKNLLSAKNYEVNGSFCELKKWMDNNAKAFGFELVYTNNNKRTGFKYEPWHYSYAPISKKMLQDYLKKKCYNKIGNQISKNKKYVKTHILGINSDLIPFKNRNL